MREREHATYGRDTGCHDSETDLGFLGSDHPAAAAFRSFMRALHLHRRLIVQALGDVDAHPAQAICLRRLSAEDGLAQRELADEMFLTPPTVSRMLKTMEQGGVIERRPDADDQRVTRVYLTAKGRRLAEELREVTSRYVAETFGSLPDEDLRKLTRLLDKLSAGLQVVAEQRETGDGPDGGDPAHSEEEVAP
jgi:DNA-binding MarR family transcriptional regulator